MALSTSSSQLASLPAAPRWGTPGQFMLENSEDAGASMLAWESEDEDTLGGDLAPKPMLAAITTDRVSVDMTVFQVLHTNPARLKRPLQHQDDIQSHDVALRKYTVVESVGAAAASTADAPDVLRLRVLKCNSSDSFPHTWWLAFVAGER